MGGAEDWGVQRGRAGWRSDWVGIVVGGARRWEVWASNSVGILSQASGQSYRMKDEHCR